MENVFKEESVIMDYMSSKKEINLTKAKTDVEYVIKKINTDDLELKNFLFTLGCYSGQKITLISVLSENYIISVKHSRYSIDIELASTIIV